MKLKSLATCLAATALATGAAALLSSCQSTAPHRGPGQIMRETHQRNLERHRSLHDRMADRHERTFGVRPPTPPGMRRSEGYGY